MNIKIITSCVVSGKRYRENETITVKDSVARTLISMERAVPVIEVKKAPDVTPEVSTVKEPKKKK